MAEHQHLTDGTVLDQMINGKRVSHTHCGCGAVALVEIELSPVACGIGLNVVGEWYVPSAAPRKRQPIAEPVVRR